MNEWEIVEKIMIEHEIMEREILTAQPDCMHGVCAHEDEPWYMFHGVVIAEIN